MIGKTNVGGMKIYAFIVVNYPAGSVCTCSKGSRTMKAKDTSGVYVFAIPEAGSWTVSRTVSTRSSAGLMTGKETAGAPIRSPGTLRLTLPQSPWTKTWP